MTLSCPACTGSTLEAFKIRQDTLYKCGQCHGIWFDEDELGRVEELPDTELMADFQDQLDASGMLAQDAGRARNCPHCSQPLENHQYDISSGISVDSCPNGDGVWLDHGEVMAVHQHLQDAVKAWPPERIKALEMQLAAIRRDEDQKLEAAVLQPFHHADGGALPVWHAMDGVCRFVYHVLYKLGV